MVIVIKLKTVDNTNCEIIKQVRMKRREGYRMSSAIIFDQSRLKAYDGLVRLCEYTGKPEAWCDSLWKEMLTDKELYDAFVYYLEHHALSEEMKCEGYSLIDCYVWQMEQDNLRRDVGRNTAACNKEDMALRAFMTMAELKKNPKDYLAKLKEWKGMDQTM